LKTIFSALLWTLGGLHFLVVFFLVGYGLLFFSPSKIYPMVRYLARSQLLIMGVRLEIKGQKEYHHNRAYLFMGNHQSLFDLFAIPAAIPVQGVGVEAAYHFSLPLWGWLTRAWGNIPIRRNNLASAKHSLALAAQKIREGTSIIILPEGHRTLTGEIGEFKKGPFYLALAAKADIIPFVIRGLYEYNRKNSTILNPTTAQVIFGDPLPYAAFKADAVDTLKDKVYKVMVELRKIA
jgi:1-acyl-sn-glycerol-3-phosphate acyltransferase